MLTTTLPRISIAQLPTPLEPMPRLSETLGGPELWIKRDDQTGLAGGGNKARKLEYLVAEAEKLKANILITGGSAQSNHCRQTAAAAARMGMRCLLILRGPAISAASGNLLLDQLLGAEIGWTYDQDLDLQLENTYEREKDAGWTPYLIPYGGSNPIGASAYVMAAQELDEQINELAIPPFDRIVLASSSGGTQAGLEVGLRALQSTTRIIGICIDKPKVITNSELVAGLASKTAALLGMSFTFGAADVEADTNYLGGGYAVMGNAEQEAIRIFAQTEGLLLDPVYTARAAAGLLDLIRSAKVDKEERVLFWHTGGSPALFAPQYAKWLVTPS